MHMDFDRARWRLTRELDLIKRRGALHTNLINVQSQIWNAGIGGIEANSTIFVLDKFYIRFKFKLWPQLYF